ncbi:hypothetical protein CHLRE_05g237870v5 [Chlamydomonas reinhardtii]|uniref:Secreted protein n=1 Tax=Chlamydomonas reinhardtii TaxID=3055 RepID=A0A2K3DSX8_CHLRE|nr:uncharacterized protein CHLRE_05g237870v5 [Chlamydomonas reinhardtii]PNW83640.1 hypothetical protein CHLRE_05g237870v5 [Chlamydomonas reinhardtii]
MAMSLVPLGSAALLAPAAEALRAVLLQASRPGTHAVDGSAPDKGSLTVGLRLAVHHVWLFTPPSRPRASEHPHPPTLTRPSSTPLLALAVREVRGSGGSCAGGPACWRAGRPTARRGTRREGGGRPTDSPQLRALAGREVAGRAS